MNPTSLTSLRREYGLPRPPDDSQTNSPKSGMHRLTNNIQLMLAANPLLAGSMVGFTEALFGTPCNRAKVCLQQKVAFPPLFALKQWWGSFWLTAACTTALFGTMHTANTAVKKRQTSRGFMEKLVASTAAGFFVTVTLHPMEGMVGNSIIKKTSVSCAARKMVHEHGWREFSRGWAWGLARNVPYSWAVCLSPEVVKRLQPLVPSRLGEYRKGVATVIGVTFTAAFASFLTQPADVIKLDLQTRSCETTRESMTKRKGRLFVGYLPRTLRLVGGAGLGFVFVHLEEVAARSGEKVRQ